MPMDRTLYPRSWEKVSLTIRRIAGWKCEWCGIENGAPLKSGSPYRVVLTVAHLGAPRPTGDGWTPGDRHDKHDIRRENLRCLCQACHLSYDLDDHIQHRREHRWRDEREQAIAAGQLSFIAISGHSYAR